MTLVDSPPAIPHGSAEVAAHGVRHQYGDVFLSLLERSGIGLALLDPALRIVAANAAFAGVCGCAGDDLGGRDFAGFVHPGLRGDLLRQFDRLLRGQRDRLAERPVTLWAGGVATPTRLTAYPVDAGTSRPGAAPGAPGAGVTRLVAVLVTTPTTGRHGTTPTARKLSDVSARVLEGVAAGVPTVRLATELFLSRQGVDYHVAALLRRFQVPNRTALAARAYSMGMFAPDCWPPKVHPDYIAR